MVKIRLARFGAKKNPFYRIVVADKACPRDGRFLEIVGTYNPLSEPADVTVKGERISYWIGQGAQPTPTVRSILRKQGLLGAQEAPASS